MRLSYLFSFILLFGMLGVLFLVHIQDLMEVAPQETTDTGAQVNPGEIQGMCDWGHNTHTPAVQPIVTADPTRSPAHRTTDTPPRRQAPPPDLPHRQWEAEPPPRGRRRRRRRNAPDGTRLAELQRRRHQQGTSERVDPKSAPRRPRAPVQEDQQPAPRRPGALEQEDQQPAPRRPGALEQEDQQPAPRRPGALGQEDQHLAPRRPGALEQEDQQPAPRRPGALEQEDQQPAPRRPGALGQEDQHLAPRRPGALEQEDQQPAPRRPGAPRQEDQQPAPRRLGPQEGRRLRAVQQGRRQLVEEACLRYRGGGALGPGPRLPAPHHVARIYVEDRHRLLYCEVPKAGCSNWKRVLMVLGGLASSPARIEHQAAHYGNSLRRLDSFDRAGMAWRLRTYTKALFVREPLERLVSAFRDKFEQPNAYYHPVFGRAIIARYRPNATRQALRSGSGVTFPEFVRYLLDPRRPLGLDIHWERVGRLCSPCLVRYDFIGRFESLGAEAEALLRLIGAPANLTFPRFKDRHRREERTGPRLSRRYLAQLSADERRRAQDFYLADYTMFNYSRPFGAGPG